MELKGQSVPPGDVPGNNELCDLLTECWSLTHRRLVEREMGFGEFLKMLVDGVKYRRGRASHRE